MNSETSINQPFEQMQGQEEPKPRFGFLRSQAPPRPPLKSIVVASLTVSAPLMALALLATQVSDLLLLPPLGAAVALIIGAPDLPLAQPRNVVMGHIIGVTVGITCLTYLGSSIFSAAIGAGVTFALMLIFRCAHSPATATAMVTVLIPHGEDLRFFVFVTSSALLVVLLGMVVNRIRGVQYPDYWW